MSLIDGIILLGLIALFLTIGIFGQTKTDSTADYFLAGRKLRWHQIGFSLFATNFSASALIGITGAAYAIGIAIYNYEWVGIIAMILFALVMVRVIRGSRVYTIAQYLGERFDDRVKTLYTIFVIFLLVFIDMAGSLYAGGLLLNQFIPGLSANAVIFLVMLMAGLYSVVGGMTAIARTDMYQSLVLLLGAVMIAWFSLSAVGGWEAFIETAPPESLSLIRGLDDRAVPWTGLLIGVPIICIYFWVVNQNMVQWVLSANTQADARRGLLMAGALKTLCLFLIVLPGIAAISFLPGLSEPDRVYPAMLLELLPSGILGLVLAGFVSGLMSNTDSTLHAASTMITMDFVRKRRPDVAPKTLILVGRLTTILIIGISALWAPNIGRFGTLFEYIQTLLSYSVAPLVVVYLGGMFWSRATAAGAVAALIAGFGSALAIAIMGDGLDLFSLHYLHVPLPVAVISVIIFIAVSLKTDAQSVEDRLSWSRRRGDTDSRTGMRLDRWLAGGLVVVTMGVLVLFW